MMSEAKKDAGGQSIGNKSPQVEPMKTELENNGLPTEAEKGGNELPILKFTLPAEGGFIPLDVSPSVDGLELLEGYILIPWEWIRRAWPPNVPK